MWRASYFRGERLSTAEDAEILVNQLLRKAMSHSRGTADFISIVMEKVDQEVEYLSPLPVSTCLPLRIIGEEWSYLIVKAGNGLIIAVIGGYGCPVWIGKNIRTACGKINILPSRLPVLPKRLL